MTRVIHLSVVHKPDDPRIYERECRTLAQAGYEVMYLAPGAERNRPLHSGDAWPLEGAWQAATARRNSGMLNLTTPG